MRTVIPKDKIERLVRNVLARVMEDDVVGPAGEDAYENGDPDPESRSSDELAGAMKVVADWLQQAGYVVDGRTGN